MIENKKADIVLLFIHGGNEFSHYPNPRIVNQYRLFVEWGASAVIAHHPHYIQGYEIYHGSPIIYSLGKLFYARMNDPHILEVPVATLEYGSDGTLTDINFQFYKTDLRELKLVQLSQSEKEDLYRRFEQYCDALASPEIIEREWANFCTQEGLREQYTLGLLQVPRIIYKALRRIGKSHWLLKYGGVRKKQLRHLKNLVGCESHRDVVMKMFEGV
jgi:poly-gamma-glutamate synthesis protein (capsule biosynthesis protein)